MTAVMWIQHRIQLLVGIGVLGLVVVLLLVTGLNVEHEVQRLGIVSCQSSGADCGSSTRTFQNDFGQWLNVVGWLNLLPMLAGLFWGAPLVARELEEGTFRLAWTQGVSRWRWLATKVGFFSLAVVVLCMAYSQVFTWWFHPFTEVGFDFYSRLQAVSFDQTGIVPAAYGLYAFALGTAAGTLTRKVLPAVAITIAGWLPLRLWLQSARTHFVPLVEVAIPKGRTTRYPTSGPAIEHGAWLVNSGFTQAHGPVLSGPPAVCTSHQAGAANVPDGAVPCLQAHGYRAVDVIHPAYQFWPLQGIESVIYVGLAIVLLGVAMWRTTRQAA